MSIRPLLSFYGLCQCFIHFCNSFVFYNVLNQFSAVVFLQCDLLDLPAVAQLEKDGKYALVYQLLKIFITQRLDAYLDFHTANSTLLKSYGMMYSFLRYGIMSL